MQGEPREAVEHQKQSDSLYGTLDIPHAIIVIPISDMETIYGYYNLTPQQRIDIQSIDGLEFANYTDYTLTGLVDYDKLPTTITIAHPDSPTPPDMPLDGMLFDAPLDNDPNYVSFLVRNYMNTFGKKTGIMTKSIEDMPDIVLQNILGNLDASSLSSVSRVDRRHYHATQYLLPSVPIIVNRRLIPHAALMKLVSVGNEDAIVHICVSSIYARSHRLPIQDILPLINYPILKRIAPSIIPYDEGGRKETVLLDMLTRGGKLGTLAQILMDKQMDVPLIIPHKKNAYIPLPAFKKDGDNINARMIYVLTDWLIDVSNHELQMHPAHLLLCMYLINYIFTILHVERNDLQLYGIACYLIVSRITDNPITISQATFVTAETVTRNQMENAISVILSLVPPVTDIDIPDIPKVMLLPDHQLTMLQRNERKVLLLLSITEGVFQSTFDGHSIFDKPRSYIIDTYGRKFQVNLSSDKHRLIGSGTYGCAYSPAIPCFDGPMSDNEVSKLGSLTELSNERDKIIDVQRIKNRSPSITHPNPRICIPNYLPGDCNIPADPHLMVMPYYGKSLDDKIPKTMTKKDFYHRFRNVLLGIQQMNDAGFYHMDIKPANITIGTDSDPDFHIIDFGMSFAISKQFRKQNIMSDNDYSELFRSNYIYWPIETLLLSSIEEEGLNNEIADQQQKLLSLFSPVWAYSLLYRLLNKEVRTAKMHELYKSITTKGNKVVRREVQKLKQTIIHNVDLWGAGISLLRIMTNNPRLKDDNLLELIEHILNPDIHSRYTSKQVLYAYDNFLTRL
jgi:serine/threonine protein kinase